jgi:hypothetical protein
VVGYSRLAGADEDRILARLRALRSDLRIADFRSRLLHPHDPPPISTCSPIIATKSGIGRPTKSAVVRSRPPL